VVGQSSYAALNEQYWDTQTANRIARSVPQGARVEMLNFLPGFTAVPATPFQRPDGNVFLKDYTKVLFGSPERARATYTGAGVEYFLFDLAVDAPVVWTGFSQLFTPESIRARMQLVSKVNSATRDLYLLTWRGNGPGEEVPEAFVEAWARKRELEQRTGYFYGSFAEGLRRIGRFE
ncbi:MAG: hypothetical protein Q8N52_12390, partial [Acidobacteriota bacterium]|nr:hypothetical protein [Acidobacteriota bacterium]